MHALKKVPFMTSSINSTTVYLASFFVIKYYCSLTKTITGRYFNQNV